MISTPPFLFLNILLLPIEKGYSIWQSTTISCLAGQIFITSYLLLTNIMFSTAWVISKLYFSTSWKGPFESYIIPSFSPIGLLIEDLYPEQNCVQNLRWDFNGNCSLMVISPRTDSSSYRRIRQLCSLHFWYDSVLCPKTHQSPLHLIL